MDAQEVAINDVKKDRVLHKIKEYTERLDTSVPSTKMRTREEVTLLGLYKLSFWLTCIECAC